jgi:hypothetical protein
LSIPTTGTPSTTDAARRSWPASDVREQQRARDEFAGPYGVIKGESQDGKRLTIIIGDPPDYSKRLQNLATSHGILQDKARQDEEGDPPPRRRAGAGRGD